MDIKIELIEKAFFFTDGINLTKAQGQKSIFVPELSDPVIRTIGTSVACGILKSDTSYQDIVMQIQNDELRFDTQRNLGINIESAKLVDEVKMEVLEVIEAEVEVASEEVEEEVEEVITIKEDTPLEMDDDLLLSILAGTTKAVGRKVKRASFTDSEKSRLLELETNAKNRVAVKSLIESI
jgi:hypothetical protein